MSKNNIKSTVERWRQNPEFAYEADQEYCDLVLLRNQRPAAKASANAAERALG
jgi:hypothetical protein